MSYTEDFDIKNRVRHSEMGAHVWADMLVLKTVGLGSIPQDFEVCEQRSTFFASIISIPLFLMLPIYFQEDWY